MQEPGSCTEEVCKGKGEDCREFMHQFSVLVDLEDLLRGQKSGEPYMDNMEGNVHDTTHIQFARPLVL